MKLIVSFVLILITCVNPLDAESRPLLVELYTSQGCSSCPPADEVLAELKDNPDVLPLSFHVDYWNYIGWEDPFSNKDNTTRQSNYNIGFGRRGNYTPQVVIDGVLETVGSNRSKISQYLTGITNNISVPINLSLGKDREVAIKLSESDVKSAEIVMIEYVGEEVTRVRRGENKGRKLVNHNVVKQFSKIGKYQGDTLTIKKKHRGGSDNVAIILQEPGQKKILGVASLSTVFSE